jgi:hypothetical protein
VARSVAPQGLRLKTNIASAITTTETGAAGHFAEIVRLAGHGPEDSMVQSYVTDDKIYCIYVAPDAETVRAHAQKGGFPVNSIGRVQSVIDPTTAELVA